ncbi:MAG TPA: FHA domain-containing protein [Kofleriaceae bacterium]|nr:FHA domain-containing protein [Kofleriaceae bacterium]
MFLKYIDFIFQPFRAINNKILGIKNIKGNIQVDLNRARSLKARGAQAMDKANKYNQQFNQMGQPQQQQGGQMQQGQPPGMPQIPGMPGMGGAPQGPNPNPPVITKGFWIFAKKFCSQCEQQLDKSWDQCPYCAQIAAQVVAAPAKAQAAKTQAFVMDAQGGPGTMQLLGWIVPLQGAQRGELFTLSPVSSVGTDPKCTVVLNDKFMSSKHAEIKAENGVWVLRDAGSTNGTYVNNRRIDRHELVDNDFIKFGSAMLKFKSL